MSLDAWQPSLSSLTKLSSRSDRCGRTPAAAATEVAAVQARRNGTKVDEAPEPDLGDLDFWQ